MRRIPPVLAAAALTLLGGYTGAEVEGHDWEHILQLAGMLHRDHQIAGWMQFAGAVLMVAGIAWACVITFTERPT